MGESHRNLGFALRPPEEDQRLSSLTLHAADSHEALVAVPTRGVETPQRFLGQFQTQLQHDVGVHEYRGDEAKGWVVQVRTVVREQELASQGQSFSWGYPGAGGIALAGALMADALGYRTIDALVLAFANEVVDALPRPAFCLPVEEVRAFDAAYRRGAGFAAQAEVALVGMVLNAGEVGVASPADFSTPTVRALYERIAARAAEGQDIGHHALQADVLDGRLVGLPIDAPWAWSDAAPDGPSIDFWADEVRRAALRRRGWKPAA